MEYACRAGRGCGVVGHTWSVTPSPCSGVTSHSSRPLLMHESPLTHPGHYSCIRHLSLIQATTHASDTSRSSRPLLMHESPPTHPCHYSCMSHLSLIQATTHASVTSHSSRPVLMHESPLTHPGHYSCMSHHTGPSPTLPSPPPGQVTHVTHGGQDMREAQGQALMTHPHDSPRITHMTHPDDSPRRLAQTHPHESPRLTQMTHPHDPPS